MKILSFIVLLLINFFAVNNSDKDVDYNPKSLKNEISRISESTDCKKEEIIIDKNILNKHFIKGKFFKLSKFDSIIAYIYVGRVNSCRASGCSVNRIQSNNEDNEFFDYYIIFDKSKKVKSVNVYNYEATHGQEITLKSWLKQFIGYMGEKELIVGKNIDAISGATISVHGIVNDIQEKTAFLKIL